MEELLKQGWGISEDGFEVLKSIREDKDDQNLPFYNIALDTGNHRQIFSIKKNSR